MKIRTTEQLIDKLDEDLVWRKRELSAIKSLVETKSFSLPKHQVLVRSAICILYSHLEGFVKSASNYYVEYVRRQELTYQEISQQFFSLSHERTTKNG